MKKGLKFWSKLLIASFFFGGMATSAMAQNGDVTAQCGKSLFTVTKTARELNEGTDIVLNFSSEQGAAAIAAGDHYYFVAEENGSLSAVNCSPYSTESELAVDYNFKGIGQKLKVVAVNNGDPLTVVDRDLDKAGTFGSGTDGFKVTVKVQISGDPINEDRATTMKLGVFLKDGETGCYSDINWVDIQVLGNIYASLTLNGENPYEYICHGATTSTNIGFTLCNLPSVAGSIQPGKLKYTITATPDANISGQAVATSAGTIADGTTWTATIANITPTTVQSNGLDYTRGYLVEIGVQTLSNANTSVAEQIVYSFSEMTYTYMDGTREVVLPIVFESTNGSCHSQADYYDKFTVHVAPNFGVSTLAHSTSERNDATPDFEFCQGTIAYLLSTTTATQGAITNWTWSVTGTSVSPTEAGAKIGNGTTTPLLTYAATADDDRVEDRVQVGQLTDITAGVYKYTLVGKWDLDNTPNNFFDTINEGTGCTAKSDISIVVTPAPILLLATDKADMSDAGLADNAILWNTTDQITAPVVCPGQPVLIGTANMDPAADDVATRTTYMNAGNYINANGATLSYTIDPLDNDDLKAYTDWRSTAAANGELPLMQTGGATPGHFLNNQTNAQANITYTVQNADSDGCALVKKDGSALNLDQPTKKGQVKIIFPVQPRPQFQLGAN